MTKEEYQELEYKFNQAKVQKEAEEQLKSQIQEPLKPIEEVKGLTENERQDYSNDQEQSLQRMRSWESVKTSFLQSTFSWKFLIFISFTIFLGSLVYKALSTDNTTLVIALVGTMTANTNVYLGIRTIEANKDKDVQMKEDIEGIKVTPLNDAIVNELKKVIPTQGLG